MKPTDLFRQVVHRYHGFPVVMDNNEARTEWHVYTPQGEWVGCTTADWWKPTCEGIIKWRINWEKELCNKN